MSNGNSTTRATVSKKSFHFVAGLASGLFSAVLLQPADLLKTRVQQVSNASNPRPLVNTLKQIFASDHPFRQLWRGTLPSTLRTGVGSALYFGGLNALRSTMAQHGFGTVQTNSRKSASSVLPPLSNSANLLAGAVARAAAGFAMMPITVIKVRYESSLYAYRSLYSATNDIMSREGLRGFFAGVGATTVRDAPYAGLYVLFYEAGKRRMSTIWSRFTSTDKTGMDLKSSGSAAGINFVSAVLAAGTATVITNPFDAIKTRLQLFPQRYGNMIRAARIMMREEGVRSLFDGLALRMGRKAMSSALAWTVYEEIIRRAEIRWVKDKKML